MAKAVDQVQELLGTTPRRLLLKRGEHVEVHLDTGEVLDATIASVRGRTAAARTISAQAKTWSRWRGTPDDLIGIAQRAATEITSRTSEEPPVSIRISFSGDNEERYSDIPTFEHEIRSREPGAPGGRLREIQQIHIGVGPTNNGALKSHAIFTRGTPAGLLAMEGDDRAVVSGVKDELATWIDAGRRRVPALPSPVLFLLYGLLGAAYAFAFFSVDWGFLPGVLQPIIAVVLYLGGFLALLYAIGAALTSLLPPLELRLPGEKTRSENWMPRIAKVGGALALTVLPFVLGRIFPS